ncbi:hypothetical protein LCGC14_2626190 [marine sediment metagenome]|uniref:Uncharacterized protein n=1 Tax=marine sediment metagenome TaxID=412755 RepID=A0A0F9AP80_9ZZZZ
MKAFGVILCCVFLLVGCSQAEIPTSAFDTVAHGEIVLTFDEVNNEIWSIETILNDDGTYTVDVKYSEGVTPTEAAKQLFDYLLQYEKCANE